MKLRISKRIQMARQRHAVIASDPRPAAEEKHYAPKAIAELWGIDPSTVRKLFRDMPGVLKLGEKGKTTLRIPQSVLEQFHREKVR